MEVKNLKPYHKNPRKITKDEFALLSASLVEFGDLSGIVLNRATGEVIGGNQRTQFFKLHPEKTEIKIEQEYLTPTESGTVAQGYVMYEGERYTYREVQWEAEKAERANILANKAGGTWDFDILANAFGTDILLASGWKDFEIGFATSRDEETADTDELKGSMETYLAGDVKNIGLYFSKEDFDEFMGRLDKAATFFGTTSNTETVIKLMEFYEEHA